MDRHVFQWEGKQVVCRRVGVDTPRPAAARPANAEWAIEVDGEEAARVPAHVDDTSVDVETRALVKLMRVESERRKQR
jgi:hypothetical protein